MVVSAFTVQEAAAAAAPAIPAPAGGGAAAALSGEKVTFVSKEGTRRTVAREIAELSGLAKKLSKEAAAADGDDEGSGSGSDSDEEDGGGGAKASEGIEVLASAADDATLVKAIQFMEYFKEHPVEEVEKPITTNVFNDLYADEYYRVRVGSRCVSVHELATRAHTREHVMCA